MPNQYSDSWNTHIRRIYEKLHVQSRGRAVAKYVQISTGGEKSGSLHPATSRSNCTHSMWWRKVELYEQTITSMCDHESNWWKHGY